MSNEGYDTLVGVERDLPEVACPVFIQTIDDIALEIEADNEKRLIIVPVRQSYFQQPS